MNFQDLLIASSQGGGGVATPTFDFSGASLPTGATLTRSSSGTYVNNSSIVTTASTDIARFEYSGSTLLGLLIEPVGTNVSTQSGNPSDVSWVSSNVTETTSQSDIFGGTAAVLITGGGTNTYHIISSPVVILNGSSSVYVFSAYVLPGTSTLCQMSYTGVSLYGTNTYVNYTLTGTGSATTLGSGVSSAGITKIGSWYQIWFVATTTGTTSNAGLYVGLINSTSETRAQANTSANTLTVTGADIKLNPTITSYVPTTVAAVTRSADVLVLNWSLKGVSDGAITARYTFDDSSTQDVSTTVSSGTSTVPTNLNRSHILKIVKV